MLADQGKPMNSLRSNSIGLALRADLGRLRFSAAQKAGRQRPAFGFADVWSAHQDYEFGLRLAWVGYYLMEGQRQRVSWQLLMAIFFATQLLKSLGYES